MSARNRARRSVGRGLILTVEGLETRALLSYYAALYGHGSAAMSPTSLPAHLTFAPTSSTTSSSAAIVQAAAAAAATTPSLIHNTPLEQQLVALNYPPGTPQPTPREVRRQAFAANFSGEYHTGPGRFTDQAMTIELVAFGGGNFSYHTNLEGVLYTPVDAVNNTPVGLITLFPRNVLTTGTTFSFDLTGTGNNAQGLPSTFMTVSDQGQSGGVALSSSFSPGLPVDQTGKGILTIHYFPEKSENGFSSGRFTAVLRTLNYNSGTLNPIGNVGNRFGPGALQPNRLSTPGTGR
jgi:hypothetical protein